MKAISLFSLAAAIVICASCKSKDANDIILQAESDARQIVSAAEVRANTIIEAAKNKAQKILEEADEEAERIKQETENNERYSNSLSNNSTSSSSVILSYDDLKKMDNFEIFNNNKYFDYIDMIIENGLYKDMVDDFSLINADTYDMILAIMFSDDIGFDYRDSNGEIIGSIKKLDKFRKLFSIGSESLEEYYPTYDKSIINSSYLSTINDSLNNKIDDQLLELDVIKKLDQHFLDSGLTYNIGGYVISNKNKPRLILITN